MELVSLDQLHFTKKTFQTNNNNNIIKNAHFIYSYKKQPYHHDKAATINS